MMEVCRVVGPEYPRNMSMNLSFQQVTDYPRLVANLSATALLRSSTKHAAVVSKLTPEHWELNKIQQVRYNRYSRKMKMKPLVCSKYSVDLSELMTVRSP